MKADKRFAEVSNFRARARDAKGKFKALGVLTEAPEIKYVNMGPRERTYRRVLEAMEPAAFRVMREALADKRVPMRDRLNIAQDVLTRLHGKTVQSQEAEEARRQVEAMSLDELRDYVDTLAQQVGMRRAESNEIN